MLPTRQRVYVSNRGHNSLAVFDVATNGHLSRRGIRSCGGNWPRHFTFVSDDRYVLVANQYSGTVSVLPLVDGPDEIGESVGTVAVPQASCVHVVETTM
jgi:6-phosphogluconolactonase